MALEAVKFLTGAGQGLLGRLWMIDTLWNEERLMVTHRREDCPVCGARGEPC